MDAGAVAGRRAGHVRRLQHSANHRFLCGRGRGVQRSIARLISAAPDMAEALEDCIDALNDLGASVATNMLGRAALEKARAALAKARGQA